MSSDTTRPIRCAVVTALCLTGFVGFSSDSVAASPRAEPALKALQRLNDLSLPAVAKAGTGSVGAFNLKAMDAADLSVTLADGRALLAQRQRVAEDKARGRKSWVGTFPDQPGSLAVFSTVKGVTTGFFTYGAETWELMPGKAGTHVLYRVDDSKLPQSEPVLGVADAVESDSGSTADFGAGAATTDAMTGGYVHDLLVVYTPAARAAYGQAALESMIQNAVQAANQAYLNSSIGITLNLVGLQEIAYVESGNMQTSLYDLQGTADGKMDAVHKLRDTVGADVVSLISQDSSSCGIAWAMRGEYAGFAANSFNVVKPSCLSQHSLAHEVGHNQGNMHDRASTTNLGAFAYSYGFRRCMSDGTGFRTVMSYSCTGASRVAWFSNPNAYYNGFATGIAYETDAANSADNARSMNNTADTVAAFRIGGSTVTATAPTAPASLSVTAASSSSLIVRWSDTSGNETGFKVARSLNGVDFTEIATLGAGTTSYANSGLTALTTFYYRVRAYNSAGNSAYSNTASARTLTLTQPSAPTSLTATATSRSSVALRWADTSTNETGFKVARSTNGTSFLDVATLGAGSTSYSNSGLVPLTRYYYRVRAYNSAGNSANSNSVLVKTPNN